MSADQQGGPAATPRRLAKQLTRDDVAGIMRFHARRDPVVHDLAAEVLELRSAVAQDREDAARYRAIKAETDAILNRDEEYLAQVEEARRAQADAEEELRLLRALEAAELEASWAPYKSAAYGAASTKRLDAFRDLAAFRARQKGAGS